ncbi:MAG: S1C family serine protease [Candidatus Saccharimonadales bacterium]
MEAPEAKTQKDESVEVPKPLASPKKRNRVLGILTPLVVGLVGSFLGAWLLLATGLVKPDVSQTITQNREKLVLQEGEIVADVFKKVSPSTVAITTESVSQSRRFFDPQVTQGAGSGIIISKDGYVLTNKHVVPEGVNRVTVILSDGRELNDVRVVGRDPFNDIAFLKINGVNDLTPAAIGDSSQVEPGQKVVAIGNALGIFRNSVTAGIVSGIGRPIEAQDASTGASEKLENLFQTDAGINPGNSGGPLVNLKGEVIGINTAVSEEGEAIGFAIPINDAKNMIESVLKEGRIVKSYLGVRYVTLTPEIAKGANLSVNDGALVVGSNGQSAVVPDSPAAKAGLREGDVITKVNGQAVTIQSTLASKLAQFKPGEKVELTVLREGKEQKITVTLEEFRQ